MWRRHLQRFPANNEKIFRSDLQVCTFQQCAFRSSRGSLDRFSQRCAASCRHLGGNKKVAHTLRSHVAPGDRSSTSACNCPCSMHNMANARPRTWSTGLGGLAGAPPIGLKGLRERARNAHRSRTSATWAWKAAAPSIGYERATRAPNASTSPLK